MKTVNFPSNSDANIHSCNFFWQLWLATRHDFVESREKAFIHAETLDMKSFTRVLPKTLKEIQPSRSLNQVDLTNKRKSPVIVNKIQIARSQVRNCINQSLLCCPWAYFFSSQPAVCWKSFRFLVKAIISRITSDVLTGKSWTICK